MRSCGFFSLIAVAALAHCTSASDPGTSERYGVALTSPTEVAGRIFHWSAMPVKLRYNACKVANCTTAIEDAVLRGINFWQKNASLYGEIQTTYAEPADVVVQYVASLSGSTIGVCSASLAQNSKTKEIFVLTPISLTIATSNAGQALNTQQVEYVAAHEMGHCLGIWDHSTMPGDLMFAFLRTDTAYTARDLNSLRYLYSQASNLSTIPSSSVAQQSDLKLMGEIISPPLAVRERP